MPRSASQERSAAHRARQRTTRRRVQGGADCAGWIPVRRCRAQAPILPPLATGTRKRRGRRRRGRRASTAALTPVPRTPCRARPSVVSISSFRQRSTLRGSGGTLDLRAPPGRLMPQPGLAGRRQSHANQRKEMLRLVWVAALAAVPAAVTGGCAGFRRCGGGGRRWRPVPGLGGAAYGHHQCRRQQRRGMAECRSPATSSTTPTAAVGATSHSFEGPLFIGGTGTSPAWPSAPNRPASSPSASGPRPVPRVLYASTYASGESNNANNQATRLVLHHGAHHRPWCLARCRPRRGSGDTVGRHRHGAPRPPGCAGPAVSSSPSPRPRWWRDGCGWRRRRRGQFVWSVGALAITAACARALQRQRGGDQRPRRRS